MKKRGYRGGESGLTMAELIIVIAIIGIVSAIALPRFIEQKDRAILGATFANLEAVRAGLSQYVIQSSNNIYPAGPLTYASFIATVPGCNLPPLESDAKIEIATFSYSSDGVTYSISATSTNRSQTRLLATQSGIILNN